MDDDSSQRIEGLRQLFTADEIGRAEIFSHRDRTVTARTAKKLQRFPFWCGSRMLIWRGKNRGERDVGRWDL